MDRDQLDALNALIAQEDESGDYDDLVEMAEGGPVGEDMASEAESGVSYFAQGGEVEDSAAILNRMQQGPMPAPTPAPRRTAAQMLQTFADGGEVQKTPFPELLDINKQVSAGAPVENLFGANLSQPTTAMASTPSEINIPTFQPTYTPPTGPNIITPTPAIAGIGAQPTLSQPVSAPTTTSRSLFEQLNPSTMAAMPDYTTGLSAYTPTAQTFQRPTLLTKEQLQKAQPTLVRYEPSITYGGLETYQGPLQTSPYADTGTVTPGSGTITPTAPEPLPNVTPGGYTYANYVTLTPEQLSGVGDKAQIGEAYKGIVTRQQADATAVRNEYNKALAEGNMPLVEQLKPILAQQESELARSKADQAYVNKYFTGAAAAFETPEQYRQRLQQAQFTALKLPEFTGATDIATLGVPVGPAVDPYTASVTRQTNEYNAALNTYNQLAAAYGKDVDFVKDYFNTIVAPQKADVDALTVGTQATANRAAATAAFNAINAGRAYKVAPAVVADFRNEQQTIAAYAPSIKAFETNIGALTKARDAASNSGFTEYASQLDQLLQTESDKYTQALGQRQSAIDAAQPDPMRDYILGKQLVAQKIDAFAPVDISTVDFSKMNAALFDPEIARQTKDMTAAQNTYNQLSTLYGAKSDVAMNFLNDVLNPQKAEVTQATALKTAAAAAIGSFNAGRAYPKYTRPAITVNKTTTDAAINKTFDPLVATYNKNITTLDLAKSKAQQAGLDQYAEYFDQLIGNEYAKIDQANADREAYIGAIPRAEGSPPEGEVADSRSRALLKKLSGDSDAATVPVQSFAKGGEVKRESDSARVLRNVTGEARSLRSVEKPVLGSVGRGIQNVSEFVSAPFGYENPPARMLMDLLGVPATGRAMEDVAQGMPLTRGKGQARQLRPDAAEALINVAPLAPVAAKTGAKLAAKGAKKALQELGPTAAGMAENLAAKTGAGPMYVVKPTGGNFMPAGFDSKLDQYLESVVQGLSKAEGLAGKDAKAVADFIRTKGRKYFTTDFGTSNDPFRAALSEGRLGVYGKDKNLFRDYLLDAAREGRPTAIEDLERAYDDATKLQGIVYNKPEGRGFTTSGRVETELRQKLEEAGVLPEHINPGGLYPYSSQEMVQTSFSPARKKLGELLKAMEELPPELQADFIRGVGQRNPEAQSILYAATKEQPIYDLSQTPAMDFLRPENVAEDIASVVAAGSLKDLERMTFSDAVIRGAQNMRLKRDWQTVIQTAKEGKKVPKEIYLKGTEPATGTGIPLRVGENLQWVRIMTPDAVELEGAAMRHSVGDYKYKDVYNLGGKEGFKSERARVYSLRNEKGVPQVTVEMEALPDGGGLRVTRQIQGKFNSEPNEEQKRAIFQLFDELNPQSIESAKYSSTRTGERLENDTNVNWGDLYNQYKNYKEGTQGFAGGGIVRKAAQALTKMGAKESQVAGKELTTLQDTYTSFGDSVRDRAAKMQQQMDEMEFKYKPGQRVFTEDSAKKNKPPYTIKSKRLYGNIPMREPHPDNPLMGKVIKDPKTGKTQRTPYEPGYLVRYEKGDDWSEFVLPESAIKGSVDEFAKGGRVGKKLPGKRKYI